MDTKDIPKDGPSDWRREPSERRNAIVGKLGEEAGEIDGLDLADEHEPIEGIDV
jgi:hypothetical protein